MPKIKRSEIVLACIIISGCASVSVPKGWLEEPADVQASEFGGWVTVYSSQVTGDDYEGELLAIDDDQLVLLSQFDEVVYMPWEGIINAKLIPYDPQLKRITKWANLGALSALPILPVMLAISSTTSNGGLSSLGSHGFFFVFSVPIWIIAGTWATHAHLRRVTINLATADVEEMRLYARYPQGLPPNFDPAAIMQKDYSAIHRWKSHR